MEENQKNWYDKSYKWILLIPAVILILSVTYLYIFNSRTGDIIGKDVSLVGGTVIEFSTSDLNVKQLEETLKEKFPDVIVGAKSDIRTGKQTGVIIKSISDSNELKSAVEEAIGYSLTAENASIKKTNPTLSKGFYEQLKTAIFIAFILMALIVFLIFRKFVPGGAVILSAFSDIVMTLALVNIIGIKLSLAGITAFLLLIGYSVDTDILLTSRLLKRHSGSTNKRMYEAFKTGATMTITSIVAVAVALIIIYNSSEALKQIFTILLIGLGFDLANTWLANASILKWYVERRKSETHS